MCGDTVYIATMAYFRIRTPGPGDESAGDTTEYSHGGPKPVVKHQ